MNVQLTDDELNAEWELLTEMYCFQVINRENFQFIVYACYDMNGDFNPYPFSIEQLWIH